METCKRCKALIESNCIRCRGETLLCGGCEPSLQCQSCLSSTIELKKKCDQFLVEIRKRKSWNMLQKTRAPRMEMTTLDTLASNCWYGFLTEIEGGLPYIPPARDDQEMEVEPSSRDEVYLRFECVSKASLDAIWNKLQQDEGEGFTRFADLLNGADFAKVYTDADLQTRWLLYGFYRRYIEELMASKELVRASFECTLRECDPLADHIGEKHWHLLEIRETAGLQSRDARLFPRRGTFWRVADKPADDGMPLDVWLRFIETVPDKVKDGPGQAALLALHFPQTPPSGEFDGDDDRTQPDSETSMELEDEPGGPPTLGDRLDFLRQRITSWVECLAGVLAPPLLAAPAGGPAALPLAAVPDRPRERPAQPMASAYWGLPGTPNPMNARVQDSMVAFLNVGQGNCNALYDSEGRSIVFYDFGGPGRFNRNTCPLPGPNFHNADPCLCNGPLIILSHWDEDHIRLARDYPEAYRCRWIAPQQHMGPNTIRDVVGPIIRDGGELLLWTADGVPGAQAPANQVGGSHMRFPWGFVERCNATANPLANNAHSRNVTGLVAWVCVDDGAGGGGAPPAGARAPDRVNRNAPGLRTVASPPGRNPIVPPGQFYFPNLGPAGAGARHGARPHIMLQNVRNGIGEAEREVAVCLFTAVPALQPGEAGALAAAAWSAAETAWNAMPGNQANPRLVAAAAAAAAVAPNAPAAVGPWNVMTAQNARLVANEAVQRVAANAANRPPHFVDAGLAVVTGQNPTTNAIYAALQLNAGRVTAVEAALAALELGGGLTRAATIARALQLNAPEVCTALQTVGMTLVGEGPFAADERYVLLTGDANFEFIPGLCHPAQWNQNPAPHPTAPPTVVGIAATHHGSDLIGNGRLTHAFIPWAPHSVATHAAHTAADPLLANTRQRTIAAAVAAANPDVASASIVTFIRNAAAGVNQAAGLLQQLGRPAAVGEPQAAQHVLDIWAIQAPLPHGLDNAIEVVRCFDPAQPYAGSQDCHAAPIAAAVALRQPASFVTAAPRVALAGASRAVVAQPANAQQIAGGLPVAARQTFMAAAAAAANANADAIAAASNVGTYGVIMAVIAGRWARRQRLRHDPLIYAAACAVLRAQASPETIWPIVAAVEAAERGRQNRGGGTDAIAAAIRAQMDPTQTIAYSYGIRANGRHCYDVGGAGHPHYIAIDKYVSRGWIHRLNTSTRAAQGNQPDILSPAGHCAVGWGFVNGQGSPLGAGVRGMNCAGCAGKQLNT